MNKTNIIDQEEVDAKNLRWRKSSLCTDGPCVEVAAVDSRIVVRDSKHPDKALLTFDQDEWKAFLGGVRNGEFEQDRLGL